MKPPYLPYQNRCAVCGCDKGGIGYWYTTKYEPGVLKPAHQFAHTVNTFTCNDCGATTFYEQIPVIVSVGYVEELK